jgi:hypothetical protein
MSESATSLDALARLVSASTDEVDAMRTTPVREVLGEVRAALATLAVCSWNRSLDPAAFEEGPTWDDLAYWLSGQPATEVRFDLFHDLVPVSADPVGVARVLDGSLLVRRMFEGRPPSGEQAVAMLLDGSREVRLCRDRSTQQPRLLAWSEAESEGNQTLTISVGHLGQGGSFSRHLDIISGAALFQREMSDLFPWRFAYFYAPLPLGLREQIPAGHGWPAYSGCLRQHRFSQGHLVDLEVWSWELEAR